jgi:polyhydroxyalkanoate synthase
LFALTDELRQAAGCMLDGLGLGPLERPYRIAAQRRGFRLRAYQPAARAAGPVLVIVPAPIKKPYIWDLLPEVSVVADCLARGLQVYLLEWTPPGPHDGEFGIAEYADSLILASLDAVAAETGRKATTLAGHSLGGTFSTIFAALRPDRVQALVLVDAPLAFGEHGGPLASAARLSPHARYVLAMAGSPVP